MTAREKHEQSANETSVCAHNTVGAAGSLAITPPCLHVADRWTRFPSKKGWKAGDECDGANPAQVATIRGNAPPVEKLIDRAKFCYFEQGITT